MSTLTHDDYTIAWICALQLEVTAALAMLDKIHSHLPQPSSDPNNYKLGELNGHYIVIASLYRVGECGTVSAAAVVSRMRSTFPRLQYALMVGIGGGVPSKANDIRLGDVVVSKPSGTYSGVVQYDNGKVIQGGIFELTSTLIPPPMLLMHMSQLEGKQMTEGRDAVSKIVSDVLQRNPRISERFSAPELQTDLLFLSNYRHATSDEDCEKCDKKQQVQRQVRDTRSPYIHYGLIASGNRVMKDSETRDRLSQQHGILCFEMETAGLIDELPALVIRGICDYCDSHKQKEWRGYAALTAAAFAKLLMSVVPVQRTDPGLVNRKVRHWMVPFARNTKLNIAHTLGIPDVTPAESKERIKAYFSSESGGRWLLIFDNADDGKVWLEGEKTDPALEKFIPQSEQGRVIFTSRNLELTVDLAFSNITVIPDIDAETATQILQKSLVQKKSHNDHVAISALLEQLAYLPLPIEQALAYINKKRPSLSSNSALLEEAEEEEAVELTREDFRDPGRYRDIQNSVMTTWLISLNQIQQQDQLALVYLFRVAFINPRKFPRSLLPSQRAKKQTDTLGLLNEYPFISIQDTDTSMHRLVHIASRNWLRKNGLFGHWIHMVAEQLQRAFPTEDYTNRPLWREYLPHALALVREKELKESQRDGISLIARIADFLASNGRFYEAETLYTQSTRIHQEKNGSENRFTLTSMANMASTYRKQRRWDKAETLNVQVMKTSNLGIGDKIPDVWVGEVVANQTGSSHVGVVQYDFRNSTPSEFAASDVLFDPEYSHDGDDDFLTRTTVETRKGKERADNTPTMHYSATALGNQVKRDGANRDKISLEVEDLCFEMEAAGLVDNSRALVVRGLSDYADSHKNKRWQSYAAGTAAACSNDLLGVIPAADIADTKTGKEGVKFIQNDVQNPEKVPKPMMAWSNLTPSHSQYQISSRRSLFTVVLDGCKSAVERVVGCQLSWWPWHEPEEKVQDGHTRVYSMAFRGRRFYNDIPTSFAEQIFPGLRDAGSSSLKSTFSILDQKSVLLHNTTLTNLLLNYQISQSRDRTTREDQEAIAREDAERPTSASSGINLKPQEQLAPTGEGVEDMLERTTHQQQLTLPEVAEGRIESSNQAWLYLSVDIGPNQSRARAVELGENDKMTFENIYTAYRTFTPKWCWWKQAAKIRFYRFQSFLFKEPRNCYYVHLHRDKERYPEATDPVYTEYRYMPQPWPSFIPYPSEEAWYYFWHPEDCGTSSDLNSKLPVRFRDAIARHALAFGMHVEERPSALAIFLMAGFVCFLALAATLWFIPRWLEKHPGDLQNATAPVVVAFAVVNIFISVATSLLIFRLTPR